MNTLLLNLTRFGDLLQTQPVVSGLKGLGHDVGLICLENFTGAAQLLRDVDFIRPFAGHKLLALLDRDWKLALAETMAWKTDLARDFPAQELCSLTATLPVRLLARLLSPDQGRVRGFSLDEFGFSAGSGPWAAFLLAATRMRGCSPFNLVDLFWKTAGLGDGPRPYALRAPAREDRDKAAFLLRREAPDHAKGFVAMQLGASENRRRWPAASFAALGRALWEEHSLCPVLVGGPGEEELAARYEAAGGGRHVNLIGRTTLPELAAVLTHARLLVSNDTGTMHLAAGLDLPVLAIFLATAQPWDTGPYRERCLCLEPDISCHPCQFGKPCPVGEVCRHKIRPETVAAHIRAFLATGGWQRVDSAGSRVWESVLGRDRFMDLASLSGHDAADRTKWVRLQRHVYRQFLDQEPPAPYPCGPARLSAKAHSDALGELEASEKLLHLLSEQAQVLSQAPVESIKNKFLASWQRLQAMWDASKYLNVLGYLWASESQESGHDMAGVAELVRRYHALSKAWISHLSA